jgi:hypothetical protein
MWTKIVSCLNFLVWEAEGDNNFTRNNYKGLNANFNINVFFETFVNIACISVIFVPIQKLTSNMKIIKKFPTISLISASFC